MFTERSRTATHEFCISSMEVYGLPNAYEVRFRPLNAKTGKPWQASHRVEHEADISTRGYHHPIGYSTIGRARTAVAWKQENIR